MAGDTPATAWFRCEGGTVLEMDLPLPEGIAQRVERGAIVRVADAEGAPYVAGDDAIRTAVPAPPTKRPADSAAKPAWVAWAVVCGADPETASGALKQDIIDTYGRRTTPGPVDSPGTTGDAPSDTTGAAEAAATADTAGAVTGESPAGG